MLQECGEWRGSENTNAEWEKPKGGREREREFRRAPTERKGEALKYIYKKRKSEKKCAMIMVNNGAERTPMQNGRNMGRGRGKLLIVPEEPSL